MSEQWFLENVAPNTTQTTTLFILLGMSIGIGIFWHVPYLKEILLPFKIFTVVLHEFGHASVGVCTGAKIEGISVEPNQGGVTLMRGGKVYNLQA
jgi:hypothetical protein